jgi:TrmH family RNA methyltransferase
MKTHSPDTAQPPPAHLPGLSRAQLKSLRALKEKKGRAEQGRFLIEGIHLCREALAADILPELLLYTQPAFETREVKEVVAAAQNRGIPNLRVSESIIRALADTMTPQGIMAVIAPQPLSSALHRGHVFLLLDQVRDPGNVGTIIRTADAAGADGVFLGAGSADLYNAKVLRSTQGSVFHIPIFTEVDPPGLVRDLKAKGYRTFIAEPQATTLYTQVHFPRRFLLVVGNETRGVRDELKGQADELVRVPIRGRAESLNVAMATGVILYEALRQHAAREHRKDLKKRSAR